MKEMGNLINFLVTMKFSNNYRVQNIVINQVGENISSRFSKFKDFEVYNHFL